MTITKATNDFIWEFAQEMTPSGLTALEMYHEFISQLVEDDDEMLRRAIVEMAMGCTEYSIPIPRELREHAKYIEEAYSDDHDMTFLIEYAVTNDGGFSQEVVGFYHGAPNEESTRMFAHQGLKATF